MLQGKYREGIIEMHHVGFFIVLMMRKILKAKVFKLLYASFVTTIVNAPNPKLKKENV
jgi:hypothetical protein